MSEIEIGGPLTPEKLRIIAGKMDLLDRLCVEYLRLLANSDHPRADEAAKTIAEQSPDDGIQVDLRRWADELESNVIPYEESGPDRYRLSEQQLTDIEQTASWHGHQEMGSFRSIDGELASASRMQHAIPQLVAEIRRLRALVPPPERVLFRRSAVKPAPAPPFPIPGVKND